MISGLLFMVCLGFPDGVSELEAVMPSLLKKHKVPGTAIVMLKGGATVWSGYYGERQKGQPVTADTLFNTGSITKTVTAETILRLVAAGKISLDEPIADLYMHPHLKDDPRNRLLTPRMILSHQTGLLNWEYNYPDQRLAFVHQPGTRFTYSGIAYEMLAKFAEEKTGKDFNQLAKEVVFEPLGIMEAYVSRQPGLEKVLAHPMDSDGNWMHPFTYTFTDIEKPIGRWSAADDLYIKAEDYARFLIKVWRGAGFPEELKQDRFRITQPADTEETWRCRSPKADCPKSYGYGLGWTTFHFPGQTLVQHGGSDMGEQAQAYINLKTGDGLVIFTNGGNGYNIYLDVMDLLDKQQKLTRFFRPIFAYNLKK